MTAPRTTPGRHPAGRTLAGSGANRGNGCAALVVVSLLISCLMFVVGWSVIGHAVVGDANRGPTHCCFEVTVP